MGVLRPGRAGPEGRRFRMREKLLALAAVVALEALTD
jgi:hypothetical protein